jgi:hypothetical protein
MIQRIPKMNNIYSTFQTMTPHHWLITIICCLIAITSQWILANIIEWFRQTDYKFRLCHEATVYHPMPLLEVVTNDTDESIGVCSLMTITYLLATGHSLSLYGDITPPFSKHRGHNTQTDISFHGSINMREWIIALRNLQTPASEELLEYLEEHDIPTSIVNVEYGLPQDKIISASYGQPSSSSPFSNN